MQKDQIHEKALDFQMVQTPNPHPLRAKQILAKHPEVRQLFGPESSSKWYILAIVTIQTVMAITLSQQPWWAILLTAYFIGSILNHSMWVMIHEAAHNLIFRSTVANNIANIFSNLPLVFPSAISFKKYHLFHHAYMGELKGDADLPWDWEARMVGNSWWRKSLWLLLFFLVQGIVRPIRIKGVNPICRWTVINHIVEYTYLAALVYFFGWGSLIYLTLSSFFSVGLHPVGARWIQEHYTFKADQETYSYYGPINKVNFNIGYHNEHHDLPMIPWSRLPKLKAMAPEQYEPLMAHYSYTGLLLRFIFDSNVSPYNRMIRIGRAPDGRGTSRIVVNSAEPATN